MAIANLFLIGPPRTGTTSLYHFLKRQRQFCCSSVKEPKFIDLDFREGVASYETLFKKKRRHQYFVDASPYNSWIPYCADRIQMIAPGAKIIMTVRDRAQRLFSDWRLKYYMRPGREDRCFERFAWELIQKDFQIHAERDIVPTFDGKRDYYADTELLPGMYGQIYERFKTRFQDVLVLTLDSIKDGSAIEQMEDFLCTKLRGAIEHQNIEAHWKLLKQERRALFDEVDTSCIDNIYSYYEEDILKFVNLTGVHK